MAKIELIRGPEGICLSINCVRIAGPKPWGGGRVIRAWDVEDRLISEAIASEQSDAADEGKVVTCCACGRIYDPDDLSAWVCGFCR